MNFPLRPNVRRMTPYSPGKPIAELQRERDVHPIVKLASNENPLGPSPRALEAIAAAAQHLHLYPDASGYALRQALSAKYGLPPEQLVLGNGSDEIIHLLGQVLPPRPSAPRCRDGRGHRRRAVVRPLRCGCPSREL